MNSPSLKVFDGKITLFKQPKSSNWFARFHIKKTRYTTTLKTSDDKEAKEKASQWYIETLGAIKQGVAPATKRSNSFAQCSDAAIELYKEKANRPKPLKSHRYVNELQILYNKLKPIIGNLDIHSVGQAVWVRTRKALLDAKPTLSDKTLHQYKNAIQVCLSVQVELGKMQEDEKPKFSREDKIEDDTPRTWFTEPEYVRLMMALTKNINRAKKVKNGNHREAVQAQELKDFVIFGANSGMRIGEIRNVRFCDCEVVQELDDRKNEKSECLIIENIMGKRGRSGICKTFFGAYGPFKRCVERAGLTMQNYKSSEELLFKEYHRDMFRKILVDSNLRYDNGRPPRKRDLASLRATYICMGLSAGVPIWDIANNCRNSVQVIQSNYAAHLGIKHSTQINRRNIRLPE